MNESTPICDAFTCCEPMVQMNRGEESNILEELTSIQAVDWWIEVIEQQSLSRAKKLLGLEKSTSKIRVSVLIEQEIAKLGGESEESKNAICLLTKIGLTAVKELAFSLQATTSVNVRRKVNAILVDMVSSVASAKIVYEQHALIMRIKAIQGIRSVRDLRLEESVELAALRQKIVSDETASISFSDRLYMLALGKKLEAAAADLIAQTALMDPSAQDFSVGRLMNIEKLIEHLTRSYREVRIYVANCRLRYAVEVVHSNPSEALKQLTMARQECDSYCFYQSAAYVLHNIERTHSSRLSTRWLLEAKAAGVDIQKLNYEYQFQVKA